MRRYGKRLIKKLSKLFPETELNIYYWDKHSDCAFWYKDTMICIIACFQSTFKFYSPDLRFEWKPIKYSQWYLACQLIYEIINKQ